MSIQFTEYEAFGPWIYEIDEGHKIPKCFRPKVNESDGALFRLKVPKKIDRRDATEDMDLYEFLINVYSDHLEILQLAGDSIQSHQVPYDKVCAITLYRDLLQGKLTIFFKDEEISLEYNAVSQNLIMAVVECIRDGYTSSEKKEGIGYDPSQLKLDDLFFVNEWVRLEPTERPFEHCAYQPSKPIGEAGAHAKNASEKLHGSLHIKKDAEWILLRRIEEYSYEYVYIPRNDSVEIKTGLDTEYPGVVKLAISAGKFSGEVMYEAGNQELAAHYR